MSAQLAPLPLTDEELIERENASPLRHEYIGGRFYAMAGGSPNHADIGMNLSAAIHTRLRGKPCRGSNSDHRVRVSATAKNWYYPDFFIKCPPYRFHPVDKTAIINPRAIFEVLSPETQEFDRTKKFDEYARIPELSDYVLVWSEVVRLDHFARMEGGAWALRSHNSLDDILRLENFGIEVPLREIYEDIVVGEQGVLPFED